MPRRRALRPALPRLCLWASAKGERLGVTRSRHRGAWVTRGAGPAGQRPGGVRGWWQLGGRLAGPASGPKAASGGFGVGGLLRIGEFHLFFRLLI
jgi:hypothetical protein